MSATDLDRRLQVVLFVSCPERQRRLASQLAGEQGVNLRIEEAFPGAKVGPDSALSPDVVMIDVGGGEALGAILLARHAFRDALIIALGHHSPDEAFLCGRAGANAFASRDLDGSALLSLARGLRSRVSALAPLPSLARAEWEYLTAVLDLCDGNRSAAARCLGIHRSVLQRKLGRTPPRR